jgi:hypothetical protein
VAVDIFIGNTDRVDFEGEANPLGTILNLGNLMFQKGASVNPTDPTDKSHTYTAVGLDWFDAARTLSNLVAPPPDNWKGGILKTSEKNNTLLYNLATKCVADLNHYFNKALAGGITPLDLLDSTATTRLYYGILEGRDKLHTFLTDHLKPKPAPQGNVRAAPAGQWPVGVKRRMQALGW